ncbi:MAG: PhnE/PtxC family ABC transporter permease, partial [Candidatus Sericytochromatia bacterium]
GYQLDLSMRMFEFHEVGTLLLALLALVGLVDGVGALVRRTLLSASPLPGRLRRAGGFAASAAVFCLIGAAAAFLSGPIAEALSPEGLARLGRFAAGAWPPAHEAAFVAETGRAVLETLSIAVVGTALGAAIGGALAAFATYNHAVDPPLVASRRGAGMRLAYHASRWLLNALRAVPEVFFALILVLAVGLGPFAGSLALGLHTGGILGKLYADTLESADARAFGALVAAGAGAWPAALYSTLPASLPILLSHTLFRWEMNIRAAAVLGLVGGGGLGQALYNAVQLGFYDQLFTLVLLLWALVTGVDAASARLRSRLGAA